MTILWVIIGIVLIAAIFIFLREFWCWYWKISDLLEETKRTNKLLKQIYFAVSGDENINDEEE